MKTTTVLSLILVMACGLSFPLTSNATNYNDNGSNNNYYLYSGDTLKLLSGTFNGSLYAFNSGGVVIVYPGATFKPNGISTGKGKLINYGSTKFTFSFGSFEGSTIDNWGTVTFQQDASLYDGTVASQTWTNYGGGVINVKGSFSMGARTTLTNNGTFSVDNNFNMYSATSVVNNNRTINVTSSFNMSAGQLNNKNIINTSTMNFWGGTLTNEGAVNSTSAFVVSAGQTYVNKCRLITNGAVTNYGTLINHGLIWAGRSNTAADEFYNSGTYISASPNAKVKAVKLTNYGTVNGSGFLYFSGSTYNSGTFGISTNTTDSLKVFDSTRTSTSTIFDTQYGTIYGNTVFRKFARPDSTEMFSGCSDVFKSVASPLPVTWNYFYARLGTDAPVLYWGAEYEENMQFEIERSYDNLHFSVIATSTSNRTAVYTYNDATADMSQEVISYRIKGTSRVDGAVKTTTIQMVRPGKTATVSVSVYPNPTAESAAVLYTTEKSEQVTVRIMTIGAQQLLLKNFTAAQGLNRFELSEVKNLKAGMYIIDIIKGNQVVATQKLTKK
jgi:hypothetical protein